jgi:recombination protein RecA
LTKNLKEAALKEAARIEQKYGHRSGDTGASEYKLDVTPTGVLALDYALGIGGWPKGNPVMLFGPPDIGKSSSLGFAALRSAQANGQLCGIIAIEPNWDKNWAIKHGVDPDLVVISRPNTGEEAFEVLLSWLQGDIVDFILFDSIGALVSRAERNQDELKPRQGGQSALITDGIKRSLMPCWKNNKTLIFLNQIRDDMKSQHGGVKPPGGHAQEHSCAIILQVKPGKDRYTVKIDGDDVLIGRTIVVVTKRNKMAEGSNQKAQFDFYQKEVEGFPFGIDLAKDVIDTGVTLGVIEKAGSYYRHPSFPGDKHQVQGKAGVADLIAKDPSLVAIIRQGVIHKMHENQAALKEKKP